MIDITCIIEKENEYSNKYVTAIFKIENTDNIRYSDVIIAVNLDEGLYLNSQTAYINNVAVRLNNFQEVELYEIVEYSSFEFRVQLGVAEEFIKKEQEVRLQVQARTGDGKMIAKDMIGYIYPFKNKRERNLRQDKREFAATENREENDKSIYKAKNVSKRNKTPRIKESQDIAEDKNLKDKIEKEEDSEENNIMEVSKLSKAKGVSKAKKIQNQKQSYRKQKEKEIFKAFLNDEANNDEIEDKVTVFLKSFLNTSQICSEKLYKTVITNESDKSIFILYRLVCDDIDLNDFYIIDGSDVVENFVIGKLEPRSQVMIDNITKYTEEEGASVKVYGELRYIVVKDKDSVCEKIYSVKTEEVI